MVKIDLNRGCGARRHYDLPVIRRRLALAASAVAVCLPAGACTAPAATPTTTASASASVTPFDPRAALAASTTGIDTGGYTFSVVGPAFEMSGAVHTPTGSAETLSMTKQKNVSVMTRARVTAGGTYSQWSVSGGQWDDLDRVVDMMARSPDANIRKDAATYRDLREFLDGTSWMPPGSLPASMTPQLDLNAPDVVGVKRLLGRIKTVEGDNRAITGTLDTSRIAKDQTMIGMLARQYPPRTGTAMPFRVLLDIQDRVATFSLTTPGSPDTWVINLSEYGKVQPLTAPPPDTIKKPSPAVVTFLRGKDLTEPLWRKRSPRAGA
ncbi:hypothetical protein [Paractinoplanes lichenicola]|uniref:Lipoprotein n=1 Tax=Paractinoplanes lichenicola TaxID=2802976 RepID=A0ABS1W634_9ACTN|nr:hypothetical protein [Actinoplanes lichenicola]MBL7262194.1 hypothetical protein [Actinoplanes lichenicola]